MSETKEPCEVEQFERKNTTKMNKIENTPLENRNKEHQVNLGGWKAKNDEHKGQEGIETTLVETR